MTLHLPSCMHYGLQPNVHCFVAVSSDILHACMDTYTDCNCALNICRQLKVALENCLIVARAPDIMPLA